MRIIETDRLGSKVSHAVMKSNARNFVSPCGQYFSGTAKTLTGKVSCPECVAIIRFCKSIDSRNLTLG